MIVAPADVQAHAVEQLTVNHGVAVEQFCVVGGETAQRCFHLRHLRAIQLVGRLDIDEHQHVIGATDDHRRGLREHLPARRNDLRDALKSLDAAGISPGEPVGEGEVGGVHGTGNVGDVTLEPGGRSLNRLLPKLGAGVSGAQFERTVDRPLPRAGDQQDGHAVSARHKQPSLEHAPVVGPLDRGLAILEIDAAHVVPDLALG